MLIILGHRLGTILLRNEDWLDQHLQAKLLDIFVVWDVALGRNGSVGHPATLSAQEASPRLFRLLNHLSDELDAHEELRVGLSDHSLRQLHVSLLRNVCVVAQLRVEADR